MKTLILFAIATLFGISAFSACAEVPANAIPPVFASGWNTPVKKDMRAFQSDQELAAYLRLLAEKHRRQRQANEKNKELAAPAQPTSTASVAGMADAKSDGAESGAL